MHPAIRSRGEIEILSNLEISMYSEPQILYLVRHDFHRPHHCLFGNKRLKYTHNILQLWI